MVHHSILPLSLLLLVATQAGAQGIRPLVPKPSMGAIGSSLKYATSGGSSAATPVSIQTAPAQRPNYNGPKPDFSIMTKTWQDALSTASNNSAVLDGEGTWSINDMVKALQGTIVTLGKDDNATATANTTTTTASSGSNVTFAEFAGNLFCKDGQKFANCSGVNPCTSKRCFPGTMCLVDMCGTCSAKCVSYAEMGAGLNKILSSIGVSKVKADVPTPNLPIVDKFVEGVETLTKAVLPKCPANSVIDIAGLRCKACVDGSVAQPGSTSCSVCGRGRYADPKTATCKACGPGFFAALTTGNKYCIACPSNTYNALHGQGACSPCPAGSSTRGLRGQKQCFKLTMAGGY